MKIALLNLPLDNNYGGNLQRYALMKVLGDMGYDVIHIYLELDDNLSWYHYPFLYLKGVIKKYILHKNTSVFDDLNRILTYKNRLQIVYPFYEKYINHTPKCVSLYDIKEVCGELYDVYVVGSDQVWRKDMTHSIGWRNFLFSFINGKTDVKKIAYAVSFGNTNMQYSSSEQKEFSRLYSEFDAVSVREDNAISYLYSMGCEIPPPIHVLDPTLLLKREEYEILFNNLSVDVTTSGKIFCYILDQNPTNKRIIEKKSKELSADTVIMGIGVDDKVSIPTWLKYIYDSLLVITDSYHGVIFSIIFNKQFIFCGNAKRGNNRVESLYKMLEIDPKEINYKRINNNINRWRDKSLEFILNAINSQI